MTDEEAVTALATLIAGTTGWNDESVDLYVDELAGLQDATALMETCRDLVRTWDEARRPPIRVILASYHKQVERRRDPVRRLDSRWLDFADGLQVARRAYEVECARQGREPSPGVLVSGVSIGMEDR